jgi:hypothetical protein
MCKIVTLYQRELFKKNLRLSTFCTQSVNEDLMVISLFWVVKSCGLRDD